MEACADSLLPLYERERAAGRALALGVLVHTDGSTYRKAGALILIAADGSYAGLISGGCLEGDLSMHAHSVIASGMARELRYDMRGTDELLWGLGLGCEGAMRILLLQAGPANDWQPLAHLAGALAADTPTAIGVVTESALAQLPVGAIALPLAVEPAAAVPPQLRSAATQAALTRSSERARSEWLEEAGFRLLVLPLALPPRIALLGAGPDAAPVADFAARLNWKVTLADHRPAYAIAAHFPTAERVVLTRPEELGSAVQLEHYRAAVVMSHHLPSDLSYLRVLAASPVPYVGLLGPAVRRERLLAELGGDAGRLNGRLHAPVGLPLGGRTPEAIALAIVAQLQTFLHLES
jgi:xanthine/CO dehydrogenase XdhC/CoxF family maturation factor